MKTLPQKKQNTWVQTDRAAHEAWAKLSIQNPKAGALLHVLAANVGENNAVVVSQRVLAKLLGCSPDTIKRALSVLVVGNWIEVRQIGDRGTVNAYILNDRVVWSQARDNLRFSLFSANVILDHDEQPDKDFIHDQEPLRKLPKIGELQIPTGDGLPPPSQPSLPDMEPDLPAAGTQLDIDDILKSPT